jgi:uncharacterized protein YcnI
VTAIAATIDVRPTPARSQTMPSIQTRVLPRRRQLVALTPLIAALLLTSGAPAAAITFIVEDEVVSSPGRELIHVRVQQPPVERGVCEGLPADRVEVRIPDGVYAVLAEAVPGWTTETVVTETDEYEVFGQTQTERVSVVRWTGGPIPENGFLDFGIYAVFSEPREALPFAVVEGCGPEEQTWTEVADEGQDRSDLAAPAPVVDVVPEPTTDLPTLQAAVADLDGRVDELRGQLEEAPGPALRERVAELQERLEAIETRLQEGASGEGD